MKRNAVLGAFAATCLFYLSACDIGAGGGVYGDPEGDAEILSDVPEVAPNGTVIDIAMYTRDPDEATGLQVFKPRLITAQVGDTVRFIPTETTHQSSSIPAMLPEGARGWAGELNEEVSYVLPMPGIYGYQCVPHYAAGMVGLIVVEGEGKTANLEDAKRVNHPGLAAREFAEMFEQAETQGMFD